MLNRPAGLNRFMLMDADTVARPKLPLGEARDRGGIPGLERFSGGWSVTAKVRSIYVRPAILFSTRIRISYIPARLSAQASYRRSRRTGSTAHGNFLMDIKDDALRLRLYWRGGLTKETGR